MMITYYTDGSASPNPGPGGFAVIKDGQPYILGGEPSGEVTTNIRMEGLAIKAALEDANGQECQIYTDSEFWINVITKWSIAWEQNGWKKKGGEIKNLDIVREVAPLYRRSQATLTWVRGHNDDIGNELADEWANKARERKVTQPVKVEAEAPRTPQEYTQEYLHAAHVLQLATIDEQSRPWVASVYFVVDDDGAVYWLSEPQRRHSQAITQGSTRVAFAIAVKTDLPVIGIQGAGRAELVEDAVTVQAVMQRYGQKYDGAGKNFYERFLAGQNQHQLYRLLPDELVLFDELHFSGAQQIISAS